MDISAKSQEQRVGIIDIGSNSVRLVIYDVACGLWHTLFNEKAACGLGKSLRETGMLDKQGMAAAEQAIQRFITIANAYQAKPLYAVATEAVRSATDGQAFVDYLSVTHNISVDVISGEEEGYYSALGVTTVMPHASGICADLGGSSLELIALTAHGIGERVTLPCGVLSLSSFSSLKQAESYLGQHLQRITIDVPRDKTLYAVGGSWRSLARYHQKTTNYPLDQAHYYRLSTEQLLPTLQHLQKMAGEPHKKLAGVSKARTALMPYAALVMAMLTQQYGLNHVIFSGYGLREGYLTEKLPNLPEKTARSPLNGEISAYTQARNSATVDAAALQTWLSPLFPTMQPERLEAACLLSNIATFESSDHRAFLAFQAILHAPFATLPHEERAFLALAIFVRYAGKHEPMITTAALSLLSPEDVNVALKLGLALRLAKTITGRQDDLLQYTPIKCNNGKKLIIDFTQPHRIMGNETIAHRLESLQKAL
jgi:exopolyphosphatase/guanosine-5'-triphosphate,3'-diphosphate pyrophosphatase